MRVEFYGLRRPRYGELSMSMSSALTDSLCIKCYGLLEVLRPERRVPQLLLLLSLFQRIDGLNSGFGGGPFCGINLHLLIWPGKDGMH